MNKAIKIGIVGSVMTAICCFTPLLVVVLGAVGLATWISYIDSIAIPVLVLFLVIFVVGLAIARR